MKAYTSLLIYTLVLASPSTLAASFIGPKTYAVVGVSGTDSLALRAQASRTARLITRIPFNAIQVHNLGLRTNGWCKVEYAKAIGWSACRYLGESSGARYYSSQGYTHKLPFYRSATKSSAIVGYLPAYETGIEGLGACIGNWCKIKHNNKQGWVQRQYLASWQF
ncbi:hypothetical protein [Thiolinea disciformis]|uniref:hypothetical protein n=1 Tax=Thiolinea disciformis TaxID=125614 RepID=UPI00035CBDC1|nr:hypothetical protein [Thiolinea disciformis]